MDPPRSLPPSHATVRHISFFRNLIKSLLFSLILDAFFFSSSPSPCSLLSSSRPPRSTLSFTLSLRSPLSVALLFYAPFLSCSALNLLYARSTPSCFCALHNLPALSSLPHTRLLHLSSRAPHTLSSPPQVASPPAAPFPPASPTWPGVGVNRLHVWRHLNNLLRLVSFTGFLSLILTFFYLLLVFRAFSLVPHLIFLLVHPFLLLLVFLTPQLVLAFLALVPPFALLLFSFVPAALCCLV